MRTPLEIGEGLSGRPLPALIGDDLKAASLQGCGRVPTKARLRFLTPTDFQVGSDGSINSTAPRS